MNLIIFATLFPFFAAFIIWLLFKERRSQSDRSVLSVIMIIVTFMELAAVSGLLIHDLTGTLRETIYISGIGGIGISFTYTGFQGILGVLTAFAWLVVSIYSREFMKTDIRAVRYDFFHLMTLGATMGIFYSADFFTFFFFFEIMSFTSFVWVAHRQSRACQYAAGTYLGIAIAGGMAILMGLFIIYDRLGTLNFQEIHDRLSDYFILSGENRTWVYVAAGCMLAGFGAKAGAFPVHVWLPMAYTEAPTPATSLLSAILSKTGIAGILIVTVQFMEADEGWGMFLVITGIITMITGGIKGVMSGSLKTTLAYSSMSQIGFILTGSGIMGLFSGLMIQNSAQENLTEVLSAYNMAFNGTFLYMLNHSLIKLVLFLTAGLIYLRTGDCELNRVRGYGRGKPFLLTVFAIAAAGICGIPLLNGYVSKTLLHEGIVEYAMLSGNYSFRAAEYLFLFSGGLTVAYMLKLFAALFVEENEDIELQEKYNSDKAYASIWSKIVIGLCAFACLVLGLIPNITSDRIADYASDMIRYKEIAVEKTFNYFTVENIAGVVISLLTGLVVYIIVIRFIMLRKNANGYHEMFPSWINMEKYVYRIVFYRFIPFILGIISRILDSFVDISVILLRKTVYSDRALPYELPEGNYITHKLGKSMENVYKLYCAVRKREYVPKNYEHRLALKNMDIFENIRIIERSLSFGLFMFCVGLGLTMIYLLVVN